ncbi:proline-rich 33 kDa extensin-related protein-like [Juglans microcarpa x Juglans regia]|uniref:proline-rich 33 kDa extensin-related protein-like n=1 Tax=Juglans microcarpa x Juglans regia TaxID=2249226 RepID=UPI001B7F586F|nr:proline-rich 33 kDa extensin-related protein-like [Juglans microcarpa x Juglans regia]
MSPKYMLLIMLLGVVLLTTHTLAYHHKPPHKRPPVEESPLEKDITTTLDGKSHKVGKEKEYKPPPKYKQPPTGTVGETDQQLETEVAFPAGHKTPRKAYPPVHKVPRQPPTIT